MIDWDRLNELRAEIGDEDLADVVGVFLDETDEVMARIRLVPACEMEGRLHFLKGSALNLGLRDFADLCQDGEKRAAAGQAAPVDLDQLAAVYQASKTAFLGALAQGTAA
ncbi:Hpt domain-containing protein [Xinfangfangia pollutisoli]|uniref:Hpt domain-containing protein n=1 Tax=Xinfangfangia pollutisoli TaxID=2865960 RepID=UPI001CD3321F|nr:Hpt domain-containing protein [Xinfangfangia pollutisoli]